jgi:hypothetical protein
MWLRWAVDAPEDLWSWSTFWIEVIASAVGGLFALAVTLLVVWVESRRRKQDLAAQAVDAREVTQTRLRAARGEAVGQLLQEALLRVDAGGRLLPNRPLDLALLRLTFDGTEDSYDAYRWARHELGKAQDTYDSRSMRYDIVRAMLAQWLSIDGEAGAIASMRSKMEAAGTHGSS